MHHSHKLHFIQIDAENGERRFLDDHDRFDIVHEDGRPKVTFRGAFLVLESDQSALRIREWQRQAKFRRQQSRVGSNFIVEEIDGWSQI